MCGFDDNFAGQPLGLGELRNSIGRTFGGGPQQQAEWWQDYQTKKNITRNNLFGSALTATEKGEFEKADINPSMDPKVIRNEPCPAAERNFCAPPVSWRTTTRKAGYPEDQIEVGYRCASGRSAKRGRPVVDQG